MKKLSASHQAAVDCLKQAQREVLAQHHVLKAIVSGSGRWGTLQHVGSVYDQGDSYVWQMTFSPRLRDAVIMETFKSKENEDETVRCFFLADCARQYENRSFDSTDVMAKMQALYWHAVEMERIEQNRAA